MKKYKVIDLEGGDFLAYTENEPETAIKLRRHFWSFDEARTTHFRYFTLDYIRETWNVDIKEVRRTK